jgi:DNA-binding LacI/PurR family transcriptional regulator
MVQATIRDVAREAAVSVASVSRVLNGHDNVRPALRTRVEQAMTALDYVPHAGARNLSLARTGAIGVVLPELHGEFFSEILRGMDRAASSLRLQLLLSNMHADPDLGVEALKSMRGRVDGLVVMAPHVDPDRLLAHLPAGVPAVLLNCAPHHQARAELRVDNAAGAAAMTRHLFDSGRQTVAFVAGPSGNIEAEERLRGYREAVAAAGRPERVMAGDFLEESGVHAARALLDRRDGVDAVFAANDMMAIGLIMTLRRAGIDVPGEIAVAGFDDIPLTRIISPALTTMRTDIAGLGQRAVTRLSAMIAGDADCAVELRVPELVVRDTTAAASTIHITSTPKIGAKRGVTS